MIFTVLRISAFIFSLYGYAVFFRKRLQFETHTCWIAGISLHVLILYIAAYPGWLLPAGIGLFVIGCLSALVHLFEYYQKEGLLGFKFSLLHLWIVFYALLFGSTLISTRLEHYDNFSHWALIAKFLYTQGHLPAATDPIITFTSYPMGSSLFVFYTTLIGGFSDPVMLIGQFIFIVSCIYAMFAVVRDKRRALVFAIMFSFISVFNHFNVAIRMNNLLVDFLIPVLTLAGIAGIYGMQRNMKQMSFFFLLVVGTLSIIKSSALFFSALIIAYYLSRIKLLWKDYKRKAYLACVFIGTSLASLIPSLIWNLHVKYNFIQSKHEVSIAAYQQILREKGYSVIEQITDNFISALTNLGTPSTQGILLANLMMIVAYLFIRFALKRRNSLMRYCLLTDAVVIAYYIGIYFMFLFSMPTEEALILAGFERYSFSIVVFALGIAMMVLAREVDYSFFEQNVLNRDYRSFKSLKTKILYESSTTILLFFSTLLLLSENNGMLYNKTQFSNSVPARFSSLKENQMEINDLRYLVVTSDKENTESHLVDFVGKYYLYSRNVDGREDFNMDDTSFIELLEKYDKIIILDDHYPFNEMTKKLFGNQYAPGIYDVKEIINR